MNKYQLAQLVEWSNPLRGRKRLQKVVFLLKSAGCPVDAAFMLHHYGPYSHDVAQACDEMVAANVLKEETSATSVGREFSYALTPHGRELTRAAPADMGLDSWKDLAVELLNTDLRLLELGSTIAYFRQRRSSWGTAVLDACRFKKVDRSSSFVDEALAVAKKAIGRAGDDEA